MKSKKFSNIDSRMFTITECFVEELGMFTNSLELDSESPFKTPNDVQGSSPCQNYMSILTCFGRTWDLNP